jgi:chromosome segregation ATPase
MEIVEALKQLAPENDEQWTSDGLPKVDVVAELTGEDVKRAQITDAWPEFNRSLANADEAPDDGGAEQEPAMEDPGKTRYDLMLEKRAELNEDLHKVAKELDVLNARRRDLENAIHYLCGQLDREKPRDAGQANITQYLARQKELGRERAELRKQLQTSGVAELLKGASKAPIDAAMNQRKPGRGTQRPVRAAG